ncbi:MAG: sodium:calcium antiporter [Burkholderiales bacterium]
MADASLIWGKLFLCLLIIGVAGSRLSRYGDVIAEKTGLGGSWIGLVLMATVTSLPELVTGVSSVTVANVPNIAVGNVLGACVMNLAMIFLLDFLHREASVYTRASHGHILAAGFSLVMLAVVGFNLLVAPTGIAPQLGHVGLYTPVILVLYLVAMRVLYLYETAQQDAYVAERAARYPDITLRQAVARYAAFAGVVVLAALWLPFVAEELAAAMGWQRSFVGTIFVALVTTTPELVVTLAALRLGALDMAIGNLFGSNLFNLTLIAVDDLAYLEGSLLAQVAPVHAVSAFSAIAMTGATVVGLFYRDEGRLYRRMGWASIFLFLAYLLNSYVLYLYQE